MARRVRLTPRYLTDARRCGVLGATPESRDVKQVIDALAGTRTDPVDADMYAYVPGENGAVRVLAHGRRVGQRNLWLWYWATDDELTLVGLTNVPPVVR